MNDSRQSGVTLACFSPLVIFLSFAIEALLGVFALWRYRKSVLGRLVAVFLFLLAGFQISELFICGGASSEFWTRFGYACTAFLPVVGIDLIERMTGKRVYTTLGYAMAASFTVIITSYPNLFQLSECTGKFVAMQATYSGFEILYLVYYLAALLLGVGLAYEARNKKALRPIMNWLIIGYASFMIPTFLLNVFVSTTRVGIGSILCGFAVIVACIMAGKVLPLMEKAKLISRG